MTQVERLAEPDRFATAAAVSAATSDPGVDVAFIATGANFPDGNADGMFAGPILLTGRDTLPQATIAEPQRLGPDFIVVLGGPAAVSTTEANQLAQPACPNPQRSLPRAEEPPHGRIRPSAVRLNSAQCPQLRCVTRFRPPRHLSLEPERRGSPAHR